MPRSKTLIILRKLMMLSGAAIGLGLSGCASGMQDPKYPIYMENTPVAHAEEGEAQSAVSEDATDATDVTANDAQSEIVTQDLPPPPPPLPPSEEVQTKPAAMSTDPLPSEVKEVPVGFSYTTVSQDTVYGISRRFGVSVKTIFAMNGLGAESRIAIGQKILLPTDAKDKGLDPHAKGAGLAKVSTNSAVQPKPLAGDIKPAPIKTEPSPSALAEAKPEPKPETKPVAVPAPKPIVPAPASKPSVTAPKVLVPQSMPAGFPAITQLKVMAKGMFDWPVKGKILFPFGQLKQNIKNDGINIAATRGSDVKAAGDGVVVYQGNQVKALGNTIYIKHENGWYTGYSHLESMNVKNNQRVSQGDVIGTVGAPTSTDPGQLHFEVRYTPNSDVAKPIDPTIVLP